MKFIHRRKSKWTSFFFSGPLSKSKSFRIYLILDLSKLVYDYYTPIYKYVMLSISLSRRHATPHAPNPCIKYGIQFQFSKRHNSDCIWSHSVLCMWSRSEAFRCQPELSQAYNNSFWYAEKLIHFIFSRCLAENKTKKIEIEWNVAGRAWNYSICSDLHTCVCLPVHSKSIWITQWNSSTQYLPTSWHSHDLGVRKTRNKNNDLN